MKPPHILTHVTLLQKNVEKQERKKQLSGYKHAVLHTKIEVVSSGGAPTPAGTSVFSKHNWDMGMRYLWLNGWGIYHLMGGAFMT